jgi:hypothetical protein
MKPLFPQCTIEAKDSPVVIPGPYTQRGIAAVAKLLEPYRTPRGFFEYSTEEIRQHCLQYGTADLSTDWRLADKTKISSDGRCAFYAYYNMRIHAAELGHFFQTYRSILEQTVCRQQPPLIIDLGCGPSTALFAFLENTTITPTHDKSFKYIGFDRVSGMHDVRQIMWQSSKVSVSVECLRGADWQDLNQRKGVYEHIKKLPQDTPVIIIASYLFASKSLDAAGLAEFLEGITAAAEGRHVCFIETNSLTIPIKDKFLQVIERSPSLQALFGGSTFFTYFPNDQSYANYIAACEQDKYNTDRHFESEPPYAREQTFRYMVLGNQALIETMRASY